MHIHLAVFEPSPHRDEAALRTEYWAHELREGRLRFVHGIDTLVTAARHAEVFARRGLRALDERRSWLMQRMADTSALVVSGLRCAQCGSPARLLTLRYRTPDAPYSRCAACAAAAPSGRAASALPGVDADAEFDAHTAAQLRSGRHLTLRTRALDTAGHDRRMERALAAGFVPLGAPFVAADADGAAWLMQALVREAVRTPLAAGRLS